MDKEESPWKEGLEGLRTVVLPLLSVMCVIFGIVFLISSASCASTARDWVYPGNEYHSVFSLLYAIHQMLISIGLFLLAIIFRVWSSHGQKTR